MYQTQVNYNYMWVKTTQNNKVENICRVGKGPHTNSIGKQRGHAVSFDGGSMNFLSCEKGQNAIMERKLVCLSQLDVSFPWHISRFHISCQKVKLPDSEIPLDSGTAYFHFNKQGPFFQFKLKSGVFCLPSHSLVKLSSRAGSRQF